MFKNIRHRRFIFRILMDIHEYTLWEVGYFGSLQDIANILEYPQEQVLFSGELLHVIPSYFKIEIFGQMFIKFALE